MTAQPTDIAARRIVARAKAMRRRALVLPCGEPERPCVADHSDLDRLADMAARDAHDEFAARLEKWRAR